MSEFLLPPGYVHFTLTIAHASVARRALITLAGRVQTPPFSQADADEFFAAWVSVLKPQADGEVSFPQMVTLVGDDGPAGRYVSVGTQTGSGGAAESAPPNVALVFSKNTGLSGRQFRGRTYWPYVFEAAVSQSGAVAPAHVSSWNSTLADVLALFQTASSHNLDGAVLLHSQPETGSAPTPTSIISYNCATICGTQRRRLRRV